MGCDGELQARVEELQGDSALLDSLCRYSLILQHQEQHTACNMQRIKTHKQETQRLSRGQQLQGHRRVPCDHEEQAAVHVFVSK